MGRRICAGRHRLAAGSAVAATTILSAEHTTPPGHWPEGESLVNDASGYYLQTGDCCGTDRYLLFGDATAQFATAPAGGIVVGIVPAFLFIAIHKRSGDPFIEVMTALAVPYTAYIVAESCMCRAYLWWWQPAGTWPVFARNCVGRDAHHGPLGVERAGIYAQQPGVHSDRHPDVALIADSLGRYVLFDLVLPARSARPIVVRFVWVFLSRLPARCWLRGGARQTPATPNPNRELPIVRLVRHAWHCVAGGSAGAAGRHAQW